MKKSWQVKKKIHFEMADPQGIAFFAHILTLAHQTLEDFFEDQGLNPKDYFQNPGFAFPIRATEASFESPLHPFLEINIHFLIPYIGTSSFKTNYIMKQDKKIAANVSLHHVCINKKTGKSSPIPDFLMDIIS